MNKNVDLTLKAVLHFDLNGDPESCGDLRELQPFRFAQRNVNHGARRRRTTPQERPLGQARCFGAPLPRHNGWTKWCRAIATTPSNPSRRACRPAQSEQVLLPHQASYNESGTTSAHVTRSSKTGMWMSFSHDTGLAQPHHNRAAMHAPKIKKSASVSHSGDFTQVTSLRLLFTHLRGKGCPHREHHSQTRPTLAQTVASPNPKPDRQTGAMDTDPKASIVHTVATLRSNPISATTSSSPACGRSPKSHPILPTPKPCLRSTTCRCGPSPLPSAQTTRPRADTAAVTATDNYADPTASIAPRCAIQRPSAIQAAHPHMR